MYGWVDEWMSREADGQLDRWMSGCTGNSADHEQNFLMYSSISSRTGRLNLVYVFTEEMDRDVTVWLSFFL